MIRVNELKDYIETLRDRVEGINFTRVLIDEQEIIKDQAQRSAARDRHMLYAVIPKAQAEGRDDQHQDHNYLGFMILEKTNYSASSNHADWLELFAQTQDSALHVRDLMIADKRDHHETCGMLRFLKVDSIEIEPVNHLSGCNGWMMIFDLIDDF